MNVRITGAKGFVGKNLVATLETLKDEALQLWLIDVDTSPEYLAQAAAEADFVFHLAGVNRPKDVSEFKAGNSDFTRDLLCMLEKAKRPAVLLCSSTQAALDNPYGQSKREAEQAVRDYAARTGARVCVYRLTNVFGKWSRPNYNSAVATFCHNIARDLPITISDPAHELRLVYIDDVVRCFLDAMAGREDREGDFCLAGPERTITLGELVERLRLFRRERDTLEVPDQSDPLTRQLYATYLSFLPEDGFGWPVVTHGDARGSFTELMRLGGHGQVSVNIAHPGITKGQHWHHTKHEKFIVVSGQGVIRFRQVGGEKVLTYPVSGDPITMVAIPTGYTHNIENTGTTDLITVMWANEPFDPEHPDTYFMPV